MTDAPDASSPNPPRTPFSSASATAAAGILDAATVVVARTRGATREILMLRRSAKSPFMPSTLVFPGGRLDADDGPRDAAGSWEAAARRECAEEAGLHLPPAPLSWFDTWLTPSAEPRRRYLARFFLAEIGADVGDDARADGHETHDAKWASVEQYLRAWEAGEADLPPPTLCILFRMRAAIESGEALCSLDAAAPILPKYVPIDGRHVVVMPHDPEYPALPGDGMPAPLPRLRDLPHRLVREQARWRPW